MYPAADAFPESLMRGRNWDRHEQDPVIPGFDTDQQVVLTAALRATNCTVNISRCAANPFSAARPSGSISVMIAPLLPGPSMVAAGARPRPSPDVSCRGGVTAALNGVTGSSPSVMGRSFGCPRD